VRGVILAGATAWGGSCRRRTLEAVATIEYPATNNSEVDPAGRGDHHHLAVEHHITDR
jgi:hypothetical protein